jgi:hypothetical protein
MDDLKERLVTAQATKENRSVEPPTWVVENHLNWKAQNSLIGVQLIITCRCGKPIEMWLWLNQHVGLYGGAEYISVDLATRQTCMRPVHNVNPRLVFGDKGYHIYFPCVARQSDSGDCYSLTAMPITFQTHEDYLKIKKELEDIMGAWHRW